MRHLEQRLAHEEHLPDLVAKARQWSFPMLGILYIAPLNGRGGVGQTLNGACYDH